MQAGQEGTLPTHRTDAPFVGRTAELAALTHALDGAAAGRAALWLVTGEAGIGKTRLCREVTALAEARGWRTAWARGWDGAGVPPYWLWTQVLRQLLDRPAVHLATLLDDGDEPETQFALFDATARVLGAAMDDRPLLVVLDDLHEVGADALDLLVHLLAHPPPAPLLVLANRRPRPPGSAAQDSLTRLAAHADELVLTGLAPADVGVLVGSGSVGEIHAVTGGNPLFVEQVLRSQRVRAEPTPTRSTLVEATRARLAELPDGVVDCMAAVAVLGLRADRAALAEVRAPVAAVGDVDLALERGLLSEADGLQVAHPVFAEAARSLVPALRLATLHARSADLVERAGGSAAEVAEHLVHAGPERRPAAVAALRAAAAEATGRLAHASAVDHLRTAVDLADQLAAGADPRLRLEVRLELAGALHRAEGRAAAEAAYAETMRLAEQIGDPLLLARAAARHGIDYFTTGELPRRRVAECRRALALLPPGDSALRATLLAHVAAGGLARIDLPGSRRAAAEAEAMARRVDDPVALGIALVAGQVADLGPASLARRSRSAREILGIAERTADVALGIHGRFLLKAALLEQGDLRAVTSHLNLQEQEIGRAGEARWARHTAWFRCTQAMLDADAHRIEQLADEIGRIADRLEDPDGPGVYFGQLGVARWLQGRLGELEDAYVSQLRDEPDEPLWPAVLAWVALQEGRLDAARGWSTHFARPGEVPESQHTLLTLCTMADVVAATGDVAEVEELWDALVPYVDRVVPIAMGAGLFGPVARPLGGLAARLGRRTEAIGHYELAVAISARLGARPWTADAQLALAEELLRDEGQAHDPEVRARAASLVREARAIRRTGTVVFDERIARLGALSRGRRPQHTVPAPRAGGNLETTPTVRIEVVGGFTVRALDGTVTRWTSRKARTLLKVLVARRGGVIGREQLMEILWPGEAAESLANRLSVALSAVRRALDPQRTLTDPLVVASDDGVRLALERTDVAVQVDILQLLEAARRALQPDAGREAVQRAARELSDLPFAEEPYADWARPLRDEAVTTTTALLRRVTTLAAQSGDHLEAAEAAGRLLDLDPYDEPAHRARIAAFHAVGAHGRADEAVRVFRQAMAELGVPPGL